MWDAGSSYAPGAKGASVRSNKTSVGWAKKATGVREEAQTPKVRLTIPLSTVDSSQLVREM